MEARKTNFGCCCCKKTETETETCQVEEKERQEKKRKGQGLVRSVVIHRKKRKEEYFIEIRTIQVNSLMNGN